jgi:peptide deformylase
LIKVGKEEQKLMDDMLETMYAQMELVLQQFK